jgi:hypothetical protein
MYSNGGILRCCSLPMTVAAPLRVRPRQGVEVMAVEAAQRRLQLVLPWPVRHPQPTAGAGLAVVLLPPLRPRQRLPKLRRRIGVILDRRTIWILLRFRLTRRQKPHSLRR